MPTTSYPRDAEDVSGDFVRGMARALAARGHGIEVLAPEPSVATRPFEDEGVSVSFVPYLRPRSLERTFYGAGVPDNVRRDPRAALGLLTYPLALTASLGARIRRWDSVISHWALPSAIATGVARRGLPHVAVMHSADVHLLAAMPGRRSVARAIERSATSLWFVAPYLAETFERCLGRPPRVPVDVAPMGIDLVPSAVEARASIRQRLGLDGFVLLTMGRLVPIKGVDRLLRACRDLGITLVVAGDGPERAALERQAVDGNVRFLGTVRGDRKRDWLQAADAFVFGSRAMSDSRQEGAPVSILEAMDAGLPVVATDTGGVADLVGDAALVVADDRDALRAAITRLVHDGDLRERLRRAGKARVATHAWPARAATLERRLSGS